MRKSPLPPENTFFSVKEIADILSCHPKTVRRWIDAEKLRATKPGRDWRISPEDFRRFLKKRQNMDIVDVL